MENQRYSRCRDYMAEEGLAASIAVSQRTRSIFPSATL